MDADLTLEKAITAARQSEAVKKQQAVVRGAESQATNVQMSTTSIATNSNVSTEEREPSSSADPFLFNRGRSKSLLKRHACDVRNHPPMDALSAQQTKPLVASVGRRATTKLCVNQPNPLG